MKAALRREGVRYRQDTCTHSVVVQRSSVGFRAVVATPHAHRTHTSPAHTHPHIPGLAWNTMTHTHTHRHSPGSTLTLQGSMHTHKHAQKHTQLAWNKMVCVRTHTDNTGTQLAHQGSTHAVGLEHNGTHTYTSKSWLAFRQ